MEKNKHHIVIDNLYTSYGEKKVLNGISLNISKGSFFGVFGKNGAGKSTLFKHILGLVTPTDGNIYFDGEQNRKKISIGYLPENVSIYGHLNVVDNLKVAALSSGNDLDEKSINNILDKVNLKGSEMTLSKSLSLGMKRRLQFAMATMIKPVDLLILDEPTNGMDINGVLWLKEYFKELKKEKITTVVCSHSLNVMEEFIDEYCIIKDGVLVKQDNWKQDNNRKYKVIMEKTASDKEENIISKIGKIVKMEDSNIELVTDKSMYELVMEFINNDIVIKDIEQINNDLEKIFIESVN